LKTLLLLKTQHIDRVSHSSGTGEAGRRRENQSIEEAEVAAARSGGGGCLFGTQVLVNFQAILN
jgi:hypothetical protein